MTSGLGTVEDFFAGGAGAFKFSNVGDEVIGVVTDQIVTQQTEFKTNKPLFNDDGSPRNQLVVTLQTQIRDPQDPKDDGKRSLYVKSGLRQAVGLALRHANEKQLKVGGVLRVRFSGTEPSDAGADKKLYDAQYQPPASKEEQAFQGTAAQAQQQYQPQQQPQAQQPQYQAQQAPQPQGGPANAQGFDAATQALLAQMTGQ